MSDRTIEDVAHEAIAKAIGLREAWKGGDADARAEVVYDLDRFVAFYSLKFDLLHELKPRLEEIDKTIPLLEVLVERRGWFTAGRDERAAAVLKQALDLIKAEAEELRDRVREGRRASPAAILLRDLPPPDGGVSRWRQSFALEVLDALRGRAPAPTPERGPTKKGRRARRAVTAPRAEQGVLEAPSLLAKVEAVAVCRDPSLLARVGVGAASIYRAGDADAMRGATDRWGGIVAAVRATLPGT